MKCVFCPTGETHCQPSSVTLECDGTTVVIQNVPGEVCDTCGEAYFSEEVTDWLLNQAEQAYRDGISVAVTPFKKAA